MGVLLPKGFIMQGSVHYPGIKQCKSTVVLKDSPYYKCIVWGPVSKKKDPHVNSIHSLIPLPGFVQVLMTDGLAAGLLGPMKESVGSR